MSSGALTVVLNYDHRKKFVFLLNSHIPVKEAILCQARNKFRNKGLSLVYLRVRVGKGELYNGPRRDLGFSGSAQSEWGVQLVVGMPDLHPGNSFPVGCAVACEGVYPALIGSDVGCGIGLYRLPSSSRLLKPPKTYGINQLSSFEVGSLGTGGSGNHFAEICTAEKTVDVPSDDYSVIVQTGSRGLGASFLANHTTTESNPYLLPDSPPLTIYLTTHDYAVQWTVANRDLVAHRIKESDYGHVGLEKTIDVTHNFVTKHNLTTSDGTQDLWIHRKGAAPADQGVAPCPGSRGDFSWLLQPTGDGQYNAHSLAHEAGRRYGRNALHAGTKIARTSLTTTALGSEVVCTDPDLLTEERPEGYKDNGWVAILRPVVTYKVREGGGNRK
ncbi:tRNA-splicing ligase [Collybia nuda]|uniref:3'-phosphate/5'-hydroxy nucleic acid ligase n=1 Tax=Collybia nuda TaxID=64659 RepID=A0A9P5Y7I4_9AGAR|nr:tRNA-splicing ligase [Collybia nuda]